MSLIMEPNMITIKGTELNIVPLDLIKNAIDEKQQEHLTFERRPYALVINTTSEQEAVDLTNILSSKFPKLLIRNSNSLQHMELSQEERDRIISLIDERSHGLFKNIISLSTMMFLTGGFLKNSILDEVMPLQRGGCRPSKDIDIVVSSTSHQSFKNLVDVCFSRFENKYKGATKTNVSQELIEFHAEDFPLPIQFIWMYGQRKHLLNLNEKGETISMSPLEYVSEFDMSHVQWYFDGVNIAGSSDALFSIRTGLSSIHWPVVFPSRITKLYHDELVVHPKSPAFFVGNERNETYNCAKILWSCNVIEGYGSYFEMPSLSLYQIKELKESELQQFFAFYKNTKFFRFPLGVRLKYGDKESFFIDILKKYQKIIRIVEENSDFLQNPEDVLEIRLTSHPENSPILGSSLRGKLIESEQNFKKNEMKEQEQQQKDDVDFVFSLEQLTIDSEIEKY